MEAQHPTCAILADRHTELSEGLRGLLETAFQVVYVVADPQSLQAGALRLLPDLIVLDLSLPGRESPALLKKIRALSPNSRVIVLTVHDEPAVARLALASGAHSVVLKRSIGSDFLCAIAAVLRGEEYVSPGCGLSATTNSGTHPGAHSGAH